MKYVVVKDGVIENIAEGGPDDGPLPAGFTKYPYEGPAGVGWAWKNGAPIDPRPPAAPIPDQSNADNIPRMIRVVLLACAILTGKTPAQAKAAFKQASDSQP